MHCGHRPAKTSSHFSGLAEVVVVGGSDGRVPQLIPKMPRVQIIRMRKGRGEGRGEVRQLSSTAKLAFTIGQNAGFPKSTHAHRRRRTIFLNSNKRNGADAPRPPTSSNGSGGLSPGQRTLQLGNVAAVPQECGEEWGDMQDTLAQIAIEARGDMTTPDGGIPIWSANSIRRLTDDFAPFPEESESEESESECEHDYVREYPSGPRDNGEYTEVCRHCSI